MVSDARKVVLKEDKGITPIGNVTPLTDEGMGAPRDPAIILNNGYGTKLPWWSETTATRYTPGPGVTSAGALSTAMIARNAYGSGYFGPASADSALMLFARKTDHLNSTVQGEVDGLVLRTTQGRKGDAAGIIMQVEKVRSGTSDDDGGSGAIETRSEVLTPSGTTEKKIHAVMGFAESVDGFSGGAGYGHWVESRVSTWFSGYHVGALGGPTGTSGQPGYVPADDGYEAENGFQYVISAATRRSPSSMFYAVEWGTGAICMGTPDNRRRLVYDKISGIFSIRNDDDPILQLGQDGNLLVHSLQVGGNKAKVFENVYYDSINRPALNVNEKLDVIGIPCPGVKIGDLVSVFVNDTDGVKGRAVNASGIIYLNGTVTVRLENATNGSLAADATGLGIAIKVERFTL